ncbi:ubiquinone biosynthesis monooxygenase Coq7 [Kwoniella heveanensis BCC8398]|uniref:5-demethoxyubiquinone hydroxylase, mitochondrial n=1 Tax=Kwoniella heveanensis BCC8398 TaxID=1296120 RepID=A0A1B9H2Q7_9TREE|nr:ubiquinone biosynthesis monooxygenase Coq7 [Kwoniella heveanensis BCC8398]
MSSFVASSSKLCRFRASSPASTIGSRHPRSVARALSSHAYSPTPSPSQTRAGPSTATSTSTSTATATATAISSPSDIEAVTTTPNFTDAEKELVDSIIRVDQAGELGANWIYRGQKWAMDLKGDKVTSKQVEEMWENERHHLTTLAHLQTQHRARPTLLYPLWQAMAFGLGASTGLMGKEAAMACTEAVETVIGEHYDDQLRAIEPLLSPKDGSTPHPSIPLMANILREFRDDELEHLDTAVEEGAQKAPGHSLLSAVIGFGCKAAIKVCEKV